MGTPNFPFLDHIFEREKKVKWAMATRVAGEFGRV